MSSPFLGEIRVFPYTFAPRYWAVCDGATLVNSQNSALFSLLTNHYGGNGYTTFQLPNLVGRVAIHQGQGAGLLDYPLGSSGGADTVALTTQNLPAHTHNVLASGGLGGEATPDTGTFFAGVPRGYPAPYGTGGTLVAMAAGMVGTTGGGASHNNISPCLELNYCIALSGIYPPYP